MLSLIDFPRTMTRGAHPGSFRIASRRDIIGLGILLILVFHLITPYLATAHTLSLLTVPYRWGLPSMFEYTMDLDAPLTLDTLILDMRMRLIEDVNMYITVDGPYPCNVSINNHKTPLLDPDTTYGIDPTHKSPLPEATEITSFRFTCNRVIFRGQAFNPVAENNVQIIVRIKHPDSDIATHLAEATAVMKIVDTPYMHHQYMWTSPNRASITVSFTFYRPWRLSSSSIFDFEMYHPLLDITKITSIHPSPSEYEEDQLVDLKRPYHLLSKDNTAPGVVCQVGENSSDQDVHILFNHNTGSSGAQTGFTFTVPESIPLDNYLCTFTIEYPPDVLLVMLEDLGEGPGSSAPFEPPEAIIKYLEPITNNPETVVIPLTKPLRILDQGPLPPPHGLHLWISPHHHRHQFLSFEFGIAITDRYMRTSYTTHPIEPVVSMVFFYLEVGTQFDVDDPVLFSDFEPRLVCRDHTALDYPSTELSPMDGMISLPIDRFGGFGQRCRIRFQSVPPNKKAPNNDPIQARITLSLYPATEPSLFTVFDTMHRYDQLFDMVIRHRISNSVVDQLQPLIESPQQFTCTLETYDDINYAVVKMNVQYLLNRPAVMTQYPLVAMQLSLVFPDYHIFDHLILPSSQDSSTMTSLVSVFSGSYALYDLYPMDTLVFYDRFDHIVTGTGPIDTPVQYGRPIRSPTLTLVTPLPYVFSQPLQVVWRFPVKQGVDVTTIHVYPILLPTLNAPSRVNTSIYGRITPIRDAPLTGYSYRCVTWDRMVAPYMYGINAQQPLTEVNSFPCPSYRSPDNNEIDVSDQSIWRRVEFTSFVPRPHDTGVSPTITCFHQVAAVCVTRSTTLQGVYDIHPLADCPSFLGGVHAIPCSLIEDEPPTWNYHSDILTADLAELDGPEGNAHQKKKRSLTLKWSYAGDPRLTMTVSIKAQLKTPEDEDNNDDEGNDDPDADDEHNNNNENEQQGWITLVRDIPAYFSSVSTPQGLSIGFPILNPTMKGVIIKLTINGVPAAGKMIKIPHTVAEGHQDGGLAGCINDDHKLFDSVTHLCKCADGFISNGPTSVDNPLMHPSELTCMEKPSDDVPSTSEPCHAIPVGVTPPYRTSDCGYGFAVKTNGKCDDCECFSAWKKEGGEKNNGKEKCTKCKLEEFCIVRNTDNITFKPEYCLIGRCLCRAGYSGDKCQYTVMYGTLAYHDVATDEQKASLANASKQNPAILSRRQITTFQPRVTSNVKASLGDTPVEAFVQQATQVLSDDGEEVITSIMVALGRRTDADVSPSPSPFTLATDDGSNDLGDLHYAWEQLQNNYQDRPVYKDDDYGTLNGGVGSAYDPHCVPNAYTYCPEGKEDDLLPPESQVDEDELQDIYQEPPSTDHTTTYIIIGVVVGVVLLLFIALIVSILYCRKHEKMCFQKRKSKRERAAGKGHSVELANSNNNSKSNTSTSAPPSSTMSTSSYLPTQVTIADPTLPADWIALEDKSTGKIYYSNKVTMESSWDHPAKPKAEKEVVNAYGW